MATISTVDIVGALVGAVILVFGIVGFFTKKEGNRVVNIIIGLLLMALGVWVIIQNLL